MFRRLCVGGWSYGGMLTDHVIVSDHRFKAAITGASAVLCVSIQIEAAYMICQTRLTAVLDPSLSWHPSIYTQVGLFTKPGPVLWCVCVRYRASYGHDQYQLLWEQELGLPWEHPETWEAISPFNQVSYRAATHIHTQSLSFFCTTRYVWPFPASLSHDVRVRVLCWWRT
jgi:hypothetical protein|eukprot:COSAG06_NODE_262_length_18897_cov_122.542877_18_plen_170_part_00